MPMSSAVVSIRTSSLILASLTLSACQGMGEAWRHRMGGEPAVIRFACHEFVASAQQRTENPAIPISLVVKRQDDAQAANVAGELRSSWPGQQIPITFVSPWPPDVIASDVEELLGAYGYVVDQEPSEADRMIEITITRLDSGDEDPGLTELKGTTWAQIDLELAVVQGPDARWIWELSQREEIEVVYYLASNVETAYGAAYCRTLKELAVIFQSADFAELAQ